MSNHTINCWMMTGIGIMILIQIAGFIGIFVKEIKNYKYNDISGWRATWRIIWQNFLLWAAAQLIIAALVANIVHENY